MNEDRGGRTQSRNIMSCTTSFPGFAPTYPTELRRVGRREPWERGCESVYFVPEGGYVRKESKLLLKVLKSTFEVACASSPKY